MRKQHLQVILWMLVSLTAISTLVFLYVFYLNKDTFIPSSWGIEAGVRGGFFIYLNEFLQLVFYISIPTILGMMIVWRQPRNRIGWLMMIIGLVAILNNTLREITIYTNFTAPTNTQIGPLIALVQSIFWVLPFFTLIWLLALFPDGHLPDRRWRWIIAFISLFMIGMVLSGLVAEPLYSAFNLPNPLPISITNDAFFTVLYSLGLIGMLGAAVGSAVLMISQFRQAVGIKRQQYKWLGLGVILVAVFTVSGILLGVVLDTTYGQILTTFTMAFVPLGIGIAILRYRLYDIDLIIRRTITYSLLTILLGLIYFASVLLLQSIFTALTGQESPVSLVISTLMIAALFSPLRLWMQAAIDRRFFRAKYDAEKTLNAFIATARDEVELDHITNALLVIVDQTIQPQQMSIWLRKSK